MATATETERITDERIQREVLAELAWEPRIRPNEIGVVVQDGVVTLTGWVDSYTKRWAAEEAAHRVRGVKAVANEIEVRLPGAAERTDTDIAAAAVQALRSDVFVPADKIDVTVSKGFVTLRGTLDWQFQKEDAEKALRRLPGRQGRAQCDHRQACDDAVGPQEKDRRGAGAQCAHRRRADHGRGARQQGHPEGHRALVGGEEQEAERTAWSAPGVTEVDNRITIAD
jgi:osmotically-inducible protein OsmY